MKTWQKILGILTFAGLILWNVYIYVDASFRFIMKGPYAGYATREMLNEAIG